MLGWLRKLFGKRRERRVIVTRHPALAPILVELGIAEEGDPVLKRARAKDVRGKHVIGNVPVWLASLADKVTVVQTGIPPNLKDGTPVPIEILRDCVRTPVTFKVKRVKIWRSEN